MNHDIVPRNSKNHDTINDKINEILLVEKCMIRRLQQEKRMQRI